jgi:hypothetical protein
MKLELYELIESLLEAGGKFYNGRYILLDNNGMCHRDDGPCIIYPDGRKFWFVNGDFIREGE